MHNIHLGATNEDVYQLIEFCNSLGFSKYFEKFPQSYFTVLGEHGINLSGGQQQLVALARALYKKPQILLLDEFTSSMDKEMEAFAIQLLISLKEKLCVVLITHEVKISTIADRIYLLNNGVTNEVERTNELLTNWS